MSQQPVAPKYTPDCLKTLYERYLSQAMVHGFLAQLNRRFYQRLFSPWVVIWGFLYQRLNPDHSCEAFVSHLSRSGNGMCESTSAYCQARQRLPLALAHYVLQQTAEQIEQAWAIDGQWQGRNVYLLDGSTLRLAASPELVAYYGCPRGGRGASHWPVMRVMVAFHLGIGCVRAVEEAPQAQSEYAMAVHLLRRLPAASVLVMDRMFSIYRMLQVVQAGGQDAVVRMQAKNIGPWIRQTPLQPNQECDVVWSPSPADHPEMGVPVVAVPGRLIYIRLEQPGFRPLPIYLFTTLTDRERYPLVAIVQLYARRWEVELNLRHVKTSLEMTELAGKSVDIVRKALWLGLTAYNLIRAWMFEAGQQAGRSPLHLSFAACWRRLRDTVLAWANQPSPSLAEWDHRIALLLSRLATCTLPVRSHPRFEPRAVWGTPQVFAFIPSGSSRAAARAAARAIFSES